MDKQRNDSLNEDLDRRTFLRLAGAGAAVLATSTLSRIPKIWAETSRPPNFIVIFTDDQGYNDLG